MNRNLFLQINKLKDEIKKISKISIDKNSTLSSISPSNEIGNIYDETSYLRKYIDDISNLENEIETKKSNTQQMIIL